MNIFNIDFEKLIKLLLPTFLRRKITIAFIRASLKPLINEKAKFNKNRKENLYRLSITPQVFSLEKMLNDKYDPVRRRIFISNGMYVKQNYIFQPVEQQYQYIFQPSEGKPLYVYTKTEIGVVGADFFVNIPKTLNILESEVDIMLDMYKLVSKEHQIKRF